MLNSETLQVIKNQIKVLGNCYRTIESVDTCGDRCAEGTKNDATSYIRDAINECLCLVSVDSDEAYDAAAIETGVEDIMENLLTFHKENPEA